MCCGSIATRCRASGVACCRSSSASLPGVLLGTALVSQVNPGWLKFGTFIVLLPLILVQAAGYRRPIKSEKSVGLAFGGGVGVLYSVTTISGPPLAVMLNNQGLAKTDFRAALGFIRLAESSMTAVAYAYAGLFTAESFGAHSVDRAQHPHRRADRRVHHSARPARDVPPRLYEFRCLGRGFRSFPAAAGAAARREHLGYLVLVAVGILDTWLLYRFFSHSRTVPGEAPLQNGEDAQVRFGPRRILRDVLRRRQRPLLISPAQAGHYVPLAPLCTGGRPRRRPCT